MTTDSELTTLRARVERLEQTLQGHRTLDDVLAFGKPYAVQAAEARAEAAEQRAAAMGDALNAEAKAHNET
jgi:hypothetical protein